MSDIDYLLLSCNRT